LLKAGGYNILQNTLSASTEETGESQPVTRQQSTLQTKLQNMRHRSKIVMYSVAILQNRNTFQNSLRAT
jgi:hypothetical protein